MTAPVVAWWNKPRAKPAEIVPLQPVSGDAVKPPLRAVNAAATPRAVTGPVTIPITAGATPAPLVSRLPSAEPAEAFDLPPLALLTDAEPVSMESQEGFLRERAALLEQTYADFGLTVKVVGIHTGPVITQYEIALETGLRLSRVTTLADDLALNLKVQSVRVVAPLPGRNTVGIEVPNEQRQIVRLKELIASTGPQAAKFKLPVFLGKDVEGRPLVYDLASMPHLLIAGRTGTGKSVCLNTIILSLLYTRQPDECRMIMIDPKKVELSEYGKVPHLMHPVVTDEKKAESILNWAVEKMEERYEYLRRARVRNITAYNDLSTDDLYRRMDPESEEAWQQTPRKMPYVVIIIDEVGDLIMSMKKEVENHIIRLAQKSRAAGIHLILATQKPTVDVITGLIKSNLPARICFQVATRSDSMVVLDEKGADKLLGQGDMLFLQPGTSTIIRGQGAYVGDQEIERTVQHLETDEPNYEHE
ncbi:MAG: DNA translocase FtsK, partial [Gemmataceae bacterium]